MPQEMSLLTADPGFALGLVKPCPRYLRLFFYSVLRKKLFDLQGGYRDTSF